MTRRARLGLFLAALPLFCGLARAVEPTLAADTHVNAALPAINSGTLSNIAVGGGFTGLLQFDLGTMPAGTTAAQVSRATLRLYVNRVDYAGSISVLPLNGAWSEYGVTYSTLPATGVTVASAGVSQAGTFITFDITATVQAWLTTPANNHGLALTAATAVAQFDSKENDLTAHPAMLDVTLASTGLPGATGPAGPQGLPGPQGIAGPAGAAGAAGAAGSQGPQGLQGTPGPAGAPGVAGPAGPAGIAGAAGPAGPAGPPGAAGEQGVKGLPGVGFEGAYTSSTNYGLDDVVSWQGSSYISLTAANHGNTPNLSPASWAVLAAAGVGTTGATGPAGVAGPQGLTGPAGPVGATGAPGPTGLTGAHGLPGLVYQGAYASSNNYALGDVVLWQGASWASLVDGNHGNTPSFSPGSWGVLTLQGPTGATGSTGLQGPVGATGALGPVGPPGERGDQGLQGIAGQAGAQGIPGAMGSQGLSGPAGPQGVAGPVGVTFQGSYNSTQNYALADGVLYKGSGYVSLLAGNHGNAPDQSPSAWSLFATGTPGATGSAGSPGATGPAGSQGPQGFTGATGPQGPMGAQGPAAVVYLGNYASTTNYGLNDAAAYAGSTYVSMIAGNHGNTPDQSPAYWSVLVAKGDAGPQGIAGATGPAGATGANGLAGPAGATGPQGPPVAYAGLWLVSRSYSIGDAVTFGGTSYIATAASTGRQPDISAAFWGLLASAGLAGPVGPAGPQGQTGQTGIAGPQGIAGQAGAQGLTGATGPQGLSGPAGPQGVAGPAGLSFRGAYSSAANYALADGVAYEGSSYVSLAANNHGNTPDQNPLAWSLLAASGGAGATGAAGAVGATGPAGPQGVQGPVGATGPQGPTGAQGPAALNYTGNYSSVANYGVADAVSFGGSTYVSLISGNHGNSPDQNPSSWAVLAAKGDAGLQGIAGATGAAGAPGVAGAIGATGPQGPPVAFTGAWTTAGNYITGSAVSYGGASYIAIAPNSGRQPDTSPGSWSLLAAAGGAGPVGATGATGLQGPTGYAGPPGATGAAGPAGMQGAAGPVGPAGPSGPAGVTGPQGVAGVAGLAYRGNYSSTVNYGLNDAVVFGGASYISLVGSNAGNTPGLTPSAWGLLAAQGSAGPAGAAGTNGADGAAGATGAPGPAGATGPVGAAGANGSPGLVYQGSWSSASNYALNDAVSYAGSSYLSLAAANRGNQPGATSAWALLAAVGAPGAQGPAGATGTAGAPGAMGATGATGPQGVAGAAGINFRGAWVTGSGYAVRDAVTFGGATYLAEVSNASIQPDSSASTWALLAAAGGAGPTGATGTAATVQVGTVATGAPGTSAQVTNSGSASAAVLNFTIPQGVAGSAGTGGGGGGGAGTSGIPYAAMVHSVSYAANYYSVNNTNQGSNETASVLTWVPQGCSATRLDVFSQQGATITVTLRVGMPGAMADSALTCQVSTGKSCSVTGAVTVAAGQFVDVGITHSNGNAVGVWTAVSCN